MTTPWRPRWWSQLIAWMWINIGVLTVGTIVTRSALIATITVIDLALVVVAQHVDRQQKARNP